MRIAVDIPDEQLEALTAIASHEGVSRAALIRLAIADLLVAKRKTATDDAIAAAFGLWADREEDGLAYQERLRSEWEGRDER